MKLERLHESVLPVFVMIAGLGLAIYAGLAAGGGRTGTVGMIIGAIVGVAIFLIVRERMWMLIPGCWMLGGRVSVLPLPLSIAQLAIIFAFGTFLLLKAFKIVRLKPKTELADIALFVVLTYLMTVFIRNPVGVEALGSDRVGGRPYFDIFVAFCGYWVLARSSASPREAFFVPLFVVAGHGFHAMLNVIAERFPSTVQPLAKLYSGISAAENPDALPVMIGEGGRTGYLAGIGANGWLFAVSNWRPVTVLNPINFFRFSFGMFTILMVLLSGFRSFLFGMIINFMMGTYFRRGMVEVVKSGAIAFLCLTFLILVQGTLIHLPLAAQRALSFLPGKWDYMAKSEAQGSTEWRVVMWKTMLTGDKYIANKWLGDGFGFTRRQLQIMLANAQSMTTADQQENLMISGGVHSGPVSTIRFVGYVGLALFMVFLGLLARRAVQLIHRARGTPYYTMSLFFGLQSIYQFFGFVLIFGAFEADLPFAMIAAGMQKVLTNSLDAYDARQKESLTTASARPVLRPPRFAPAGRMASRR